MKKEIPILFNEQMVRAILDGRKTQTRRVMKRQPHEELSISTGLFHPELYDRYGVGYPGPEVFGASCADGLWAIQAPSKPGDLLYVRETYCEESTDGANWFKVYRADMPNYPMGSSRWTPSIHMPKSAARIWLEVESVRVERLQDISEDDAKAEGIEPAVNRFDPSRVAFTVFGEVDAEDPDWTGSPVYSFTSLWCSVYGAESWDANPWVWVITFKVVSTAGKPNN